MSPTLATAGSNACSPLSTAALALIARPNHYFIHDVCPTAPTNDAPIEVELEALTQDLVQHEEDSDDVISLESGFSELLTTEDADVAELRKRCNELEQVNARLCQEKDELVVKRDELEGRVETLEDQLSQKPVASCDCREHCDALSAQNADLVQKQELLVAGMATLRGEVAQATERAELGESNLAGFRGRLRELANDVQHLSENNEALVAAKEKLGSQLALERDAFGQRCGQLQAENDRLVVAEKTLISANEQLSAQLNATSQALEQSRERSSALQSHNNDIVRERDALTSRNAVLATNLSELAAELKKTKNMLGDYQGRYAALKEHSKGLSAENRRVAHELDVADKRIAKLSTKMKTNDDNHAKLVDKWRDAYNGLASDKDSLAGEVAQLQKDLADRDRKLGDALVWSSDMLTEIGGLKEQSTKLERAVRMSRQSLEQGTREDRLRAGLHGNVTLSPTRVYLFARSPMSAILKLVYPRQPSPTAPMASVRDEVEEMLHQGASFESDEDVHSESDLISLSSGFSNILYAEARKLEGLRERCALLEKTNAILGREKAALTTEREGLQGKVEALEVDVREWSQAIRDSGEHCDALEARNADFTRKQEPLETGAHTLHHELGQLVDDASARRSDLGLRGRLGRLKGECLRLGQDNGTLLAEKKRLENQLALERDAFGQRCDTLHAENVKVVETKKALASANVSVTQLTAQLNEKSEVLERTRRQCTTLRSHNTALNYERDSLASQVDTLNVDVSKLADSLEKNEAAYQSSKEHCEALADRNRVLTQEKDTVTSERDAYNQRINGLVAEMETKAKDHAEHIEIWRRSHNTLDYNRTSLSGQVTQLSNDLANRNRAYGEAKERCADLEARVERLETRKKSLKAERDSLRNAIHQSQQSLPSGQFGGNTYHWPHPTVATPFWAQGAYR
ncbi:hypothetical protein CONPUDRAFT_144651 [Coniophora puteana RWD-64-598 SS2]|uniref:Uncharacterized protein n=1 Tax=Coniophora puteana (strain RWD-64-598) TaxID=741705 RepID=A0A5M3MNA9_CONPW|nr:uncharacterized protein CONPUDRAFT_144651 [Coniophora puteana RWD-64-598 SS2]EIW80652.1 hypothetical protein CONPUDRAFT_144651 [Coniophora puteana RWD-64-598 SS2]